jgi:RNA 2',3'-cyclic 3'-phosphodiesterase
MRLFVALTVPRQVQQRLSVCCGYCSQADWRWVPPENLHITLRFLGLCDDERLELALRTCQFVAGTHQPVELTCKGTGTFPQHSRRTRILWAGLQPEEPLVELWRQLGEHFGGDGGSSYTPHITLARSKAKQGVSGFSIPRQLKGRTWGCWRAEQLALMESQLGHGAPRYLTHKRWLLS